MSVLSMQDDAVQCSEKNVLAPQYGAGTLHQVLAVTVPNSTQQVFYSTMVTLVYPRSECLPRSMGTC